MAVIVVEPPVGPHGIAVIAITLWAITKRQDVTKRCKHVNFVEHSLVPGEQVGDRSLFQSESPVRSCYMT